MNREPLLKKGTWTALAAAVIALLVAVGLPISTELKTAILAVIGAVWPIVTAVWARPDVTPVNDPRDDRGESLLEGWK